MKRPEDASRQAESTRLAWYQGVPRYAWLVLLISALGWLFDTMDQNLFNLVRSQSLRELLQPAVAPKMLSAVVQNYAGIMTTVFLLGWAAGGFIFGVLGDRIGRTRTMMITILIYALFTGLNGLVHDPITYGLCRFLTALGVGGEFAAGTALVAEVWPQRSRAMALGALQSSSAIGNILAALITLSLSSLGWRWCFAVGAAPALLVLWIRGGVKEPERWQQEHDRAMEQGSTGEMGNIGELFTNPRWRRNTIAGMLLAAAGVGGVWGVGFFLPDLIGVALKAYAATPAEMLVLKSKISIAQQVGAFFGMFSFAPISQRLGRRPALLMFFLLAFIAVQTAFAGIHDIASAYLLALPLGFCALAPFSAYAVYFPELFPTRLRSTGVGFCYNGARVIAAAAPFLLGNLTQQYARAHPGAVDPAAGFRWAASIVAFVYVVGLVGLAIAPETRGEPLPD